MPTEMRQAGSPSPQRIQEDYRQMINEALDRRRLAIAERLYSPAEVEGLPLAALAVALGLGNPVAAADIQAAPEILANPAAWSG